jgi:hypothetical protein
MPPERYRPFQMRNGVAGDKTVAAAARGPRRSRAWRHGFIRSTKHAGSRFQARADARVTEPTGGPGAELATLEDAARPALWPNRAGDPKHRCTFFLGVRAPPPRLTAPLAWSGRGSFLLNGGDFLGLQAA